MHLSIHLRHGYEHERNERKRAMERTIRRRKDEYFAGRFYNTEEILASLKKHFDVETDREVFHEAFRWFHPRPSKRAEDLCAQTYADCCSGSALPPFVLGVYHRVVLKKELPT